MKKKKYSFEAVIAVLLLAVMLVVLTGQVVGRYVFSSSNSWSEELARYLFVWFVMITASLACLENAHIKVDVAINLFPQKLRPWIECLGLLIFIVYALVTAYLSGKYAVNMAKIGQVSQGLSLPMVYVYSAIPICHILMAIRSAVWLVYKVRKMPETQLEPTDPPEETEDKT